MKKTLFFVCLYLTVSILYGREEKEVKKDELYIGTTVPMFISTNIYGKEVNSEKLKGKVLIITLGFTVKQSPEREKYQIKIREFYNTYKDKGLEIIRIASKKGVPPLISKAFVEDRARKSCAKNNETWGVIIDWDWSLKQLFKMADGPLVFVIDKLGIIRYKKKGHLTIDNELEELIQKLLKESPNG